LETEDEGRRSVSEETRRKNADSGRKGGVLSPWYGEKISGARGAILRKKASGETA